MDSCSRYGMHGVCTVLVVLASSLLAFCVFARAEVTADNASSKINTDVTVAGAATAAPAADAAANASDSVGNLVLKFLSRDGGVLTEQNERPRMSLSEAEAEISKWVCGMNSELYFVIANPRSGSQLGAEFIKSLPMTRVRHDCVDFMVFSQRDEASNAMGIGRIAMAVSALKVLYEHQHGNDAKGNSSGRLTIPIEERVRVIAVGGDGAFAGMLQAITNAGVDMNFVAVGIIPSGTGNDLAHTYGWVKPSFPTKDPLEPENFKKLISILRSSDLVPHDSWMVVVRTDPNSGGFEAWSPKEGKVRTLGTDRNGGPKVKAFIINNYFGIGFDGLVGISVEKHRGKSRLWNRAMYGFFFMRYLPTSLAVCDFVDTLYTLKPQVVAIVSNNESLRRVPGLLPCVSLTFQNSRTIMGGVELWTPSFKLGVKPPSDPRVFSQYSLFTKQLVATRADSGDGKIELFSMESKVDYAKAATLPVNAIQRVMQGRGPYLLTFKESVPSMPIQVDGEFYIVSKLTSVSVQSSGTCAMLRYRDRK
uniref:Diacylglycerol kinase n=1 Tax=Eimeria falciformis TaxID=84963 RepID=A0A221S5Z5_9EIME|nr:diacylglycerol kinase 2 [Eimeria falciformis]